MSEDAFPCPCCQVGYCEPGTGTYLRVVGDMLVSAPDMPAWTCDVCNYQEFEPEAVLRLDLLLGQPDDTVTDSQRINTKTQPTETLVPRRAKP